jgi:hypothetical protein
MSFVLVRLNNWMGQNMPKILTDYIQVVIFWDIRFTKLSVLLKKTFLDFFSIVMFSLLVCSIIPVLTPFIHYLALYLYCCQECCIYIAIRSAVSILLSGVVYLYRYQECCIYIAIRSAVSILLSGVLNFKVKTQNKIRSAIDVYKYRLHIQNSTHLCTECVVSSENERVLQNCAVFIYAFSY